MLNMSFSSFNTYVQSYHITFWRQKLIQTCFDSPLDWMELQQHMHMAWLQVYPNGLFSKGKAVAIGPIFGPIVSLVT